MKRTSEKEGIKRMTMNKIIAIILVYILLLLPLGCGGTSDSGDNAIIGFNLQQGGATIFIAASDSQDTDKAKADYVCDGTADEVQINAALLTTSTTGLHVELSEGNFYIAAPIMLSSRIRLSGQGKYITYIYLADNSDCNMIESDANVDLAILEDFALGGNKANQSSGHGIVSGTSSASGKSINTLTMRGVYLGSLKEDGIHRSGVSTNWRIYDSTVSNCGGNGIYTDASGGGLWVDSVYSLGHDEYAMNIVIGNDVWITDSTFDQSAHGLVVGTLGNAWITNNYFGANTGIGLYMGGVVNDTHISNNTFYLNSGALHAGGYFSGVFTRCTLTNNNGIGNTYNGIRVVTGAWTDSIITGNTGSQNGSNDILVDAPLVRTFVSGNNDFVASGERRVASGALTAGTSGSFAFAWQNYHDQDVIVDKVVIDITSAGGSASAVLTVGTAATATTEGNNFIDVDGGALLNTGATYDSIENAGTSGERFRLVYADNAAADWVTGRIKVNHANELAGKYHIYYIGR